MIRLAKINKTYHLGAKPLHVLKNVDLEIEDGEMVSEQLKRIKALGVGLHLDDFGTGYSSLSCLHQLPIDVVKIDRAFTATMDSNRDCVAIIQAITTLAYNLRMQVVVEGVETQDQLNRLIALKCSYGQGYLFSQALGKRTAGESGLPIYQHGTAAADTRSTDKIEAQGGVDFFTYFIEGYEQGQAICFLQLKGLHVRRAGLILRVVAQDVKAQLSPGCLDNVTHHSLPPVAHCGHDIALAKGV